MLCLGHKDNEQLFCDSNKLSDTSSFMVSCFLLLQIGGENFELAGKVPGEMVNLQKVNLPKSQPIHKMTKMLWLVFVAS
jgi:hypothetical protein